MCIRDRDKGNTSQQSAIIFFGDFKGGGLFVRTPTGVKKYTAKRTWHYYDGQRDEHWTEPFTGDRWSLVAYQHK